MIILLYCVEVCSDLISCIDEAMPIYWATIDFFITIGT